jgi:hypothetical protein
MPSPFHPQRRAIRRGRHTDFSLTFLLDNDSPASFLIVMDLDLALLRSYSTSLNAQSKKWKRAQTNQSSLRVPEGFEICFIRGVATV